MIRRSPRSTLLPYTTLFRSVITKKLWGAFHQLTKKDGVKYSLRSEEHTSELQSPCNLVCRLQLEKKKKQTTATYQENRTRLRALTTDQDCSRAVHTIVLCAVFMLLLACTDWLFCFFFFFNDTATTEIYPLSLHDARPIYGIVVLGAARADGIVAFAHGFQQIRQRA